MRISLFLILLFFSFFNYSQAEIKEPGKVNSLNCAVGALDAYFELQEYLEKKPKNLGENWVAPNAVIIGDVTLEKNSSVWFNATLRGDIENIHIGEGSNVQDGSVLHTDPGYPLKIGKNVTIGHLVMLHGCTIDDNSLIGIGAVVLNRAKIGKNCIIGAKSLVTERKEIPDNSLVMGSPAKIIRQLTEDEIEAVKQNAIRYQENWKKYSKSVF